MGRECQQIAFLHVSEMLFVDKLVLSVSAQSVCLPLPLYTSHKASVYVIFIASYSHEETNHPLIQMRDPLARITADGPHYFVISYTSVPHHQYLSVSVPKSGVNRCHFDKVSHCGEMRSNKPLR